LLVISFIVICCPFSVPYFLFLISYFLFAFPFKLIEIRYMPIPEIKPTEISLLFLILLALKICLKVIKLMEKEKGKEKN